MSKYVILLTDAHEAPAYELIEALRVAGVKTLIEGLREVEIEAALALQGERTDEVQGPPPLAVLYEVVPGADIVELRAAIAHAKTFWPGAPLVACRRQSSGYQSLNLRNLDGASLKRLGFRAIADKAAQLPALLHEVEGPGVTGDQNSAAHTALAGLEALVAADRWTIYLLSDSQPAGASGLEQLATRKHG